MRMRLKKHLSFTSLRQSLSACFESIQEHRQKNKINYSIHDSMMSGFACMYFQDPSLLQFQQRLEKATQRNNLRTLFRFAEIPEATQMRRIIDEVDSENLRVFFDEYFARLQRGKHLEQYQIFPGLYLASVDGTQYCSSDSVCCERCLTANKKKSEKEYSNKDDDEDVNYSHKVLQAAIMHPDIKQVIPLMPEEISNEDGTKKQDCEVNAAKRLILKFRKDHPQLGIILNGDDLYSRQPMIEEALKSRMHYLFVAKPDSHKYLMEWLEAYPKLHCKEETGKKGERRIYEWMNDVPLHGGENAIKVNYFRFTIIKTDENGEEKITYKSSWVTDLEVTEDKIVKLVAAARCRWKIENECFNTLKNQGYCIEHNYGHGDKNLCFNFYLLTLIAFAFHQVFELTDKLYQECQKSFHNKRHLWETLRAYLKILVFATWESLLNFSLDPERYERDKLAGKLVT